MNNSNLKTSPLAIKDNGIASYHVLSSQANPTTIEGMDKTEKHQNWLDMGQAIQIITPLSQRTGKKHHKLHSLYGLWRPFKIDKTEEDMEEIRRDMWSNFAI